MAQGYNSRLDESMGARNGKKSKCMEKAMGKKAYSGNKSSAQGCYHNMNLKFVKHNF